GIEAVGEAVERRQEVPATQLTRERGHQRVRVALAHEGEELIKPIEMCRAYPLWVGLEVGPDEEHAEMIGSECGDRVEIPLDGVWIPVIPAEPPVVRGCVVHAEAMAHGIEAGRLKSLRSKYAGEPVALDGNGACNCCAA